MLTKAELEAKKLRDKQELKDHLTVVIGVPIVLGLFAISFMKLFIW